MKMTKWLISAAGLLALPLVLFGGGFWLQLGNPQASPEATALKAVLTVQPVGCHEPEKAKVTATAVGVVNGKRQTIPLKLIALSTPATYALTQQWPAEGKWAIQLVAVKDDAITSAIATAGPNGVDRTKAKFFKGEPEAQQLEAALR